MSVPQLLLQALGEALLDGKGVVFRPLVLAPVVHVEVVGGDVVVLGAVVLFQGPAALLLGFHLGDGHIPGFVVGTSLGRVVHHGVVVEHFADVLLQGLHRHLDQLDGLDLER